VLGFRKGIIDMRFEEGKTNMTAPTVRHVTLVSLLLALCSAWGLDVAMGGDVEHAVAGVVTRIDAAAKTIALKTADGTEHVFKYTDKTTVHLAKATGEETKAGTIDTYMAGKEGTHAVISYTAKGGKETAVHVQDLGDHSLKTGEGTVTRLDKAGRTVTIRAEDGSETTYHVAKHAAIDTEHGVTKDSEFIAKKGEKVSVHYTDEAGEKVVHLFKHV
jgi:hypothetical protein